MSLGTRGKPRDRQRHSRGSTTYPRLDGDRKRKACSSIGPRRVRDPEQQLRALVAQATTWLSQNEAHEVSSVCVQIERNGGVVWCYRSTASRSESATQSPGPSSASQGPHLPEDDTTTVRQSVENPQGLWCNSALWQPPPTISHFPPDVAPIEASTTHVDAGSAPASLKCYQADPPAEESLEIDDGSDAADNVGDGVLAIPGQRLYIDQTEMVTVYYNELLSGMQQLWSKNIAKAWIKGICPKKQAKFPYMNRRRRELKLSDDSTVPGWWPDLSVCPFVEPDHIKKHERQALLLHIIRLRPTPEQLCEWNKDSSINELRPGLLRGHLWTDFLQSLTPDSLFYGMNRDTTAKKERRRNLLAEIFYVARCEEIFVRHGKRISSPLYLTTAKDNYYRAKNAARSPSPRIVEEVESKPSDAPQGLPLSSVGHYPLQRPNIDRGSVKSDPSAALPSLWPGATIETNHELSAHVPGCDNSHYHARDWTPAVPEMDNNSYASKMSLSRMTSTTGELDIYGSSTCGASVAVASPFSSASNLGTHRPLDAYQADVPWQPFGPASESCGRGDSHPMSAWMAPHNSSIVCGDLSDTVSQHESFQGTAFPTTGFCPSPASCDTYALAVPTPTSVPVHAEHYGPRWPNMMPQNGRFR